MTRAGQGLICSIILKGVKNSFLKTDLHSLIHIRVFMNKLIFMSKIGRYLLVQCTIYKYRFADIYAQKYLPFN